MPTTGNLGDGGQHIEVSHIVSTQDVALARDYLVGGGVPCGYVRSVNDIDRAVKQSLESDWRPP